MKEKKRMFRPREYGWGVTPQTRGGVLAVVCYLVVVVAPILIAVFLASNGFRVHSSTLTLPIVLAMIWLFICVIAAFIFVAWYLKRYDLK